MCRKITVVRTPRKVEMKVVGSLRGRDGRGSPRDKIDKRKKKEKNEEKRKF